jgi:hypothetical protein
LSIIKPSRSFSQTDSLTLSIDYLKTIRGKLIVCDSLQKYFDFSVLENLELRKAIKTIGEENAYILGENKANYLQINDLKKVIEKQKKKSKMLGVFLGAGLGVVVVVAFLSFLVK